MLRGLPFTAVLYVMDNTCWYSVISLSGVVCDIFTSPQPSLFISFFPSSTSSFFFFFLSLNLSAIYPPIYFPYFTYPLSRRASDLPIFLPSTFQIYTQI